MTDYNKYFEANKNLWNRLIKGLEDKIPMVYSVKARPTGVIRAGNKETGLKDERINRKNGE